MIRDDQEAEQVLLALARMASVSRQPLILCVDQVDNLDPDKLRPSPSSSTRCWTTRPTCS